MKSLEVRWPVVLGAVALAFFQTGGTIGASRNQTGDRGIDALVTSPEFSPQGRACTSRP